MQQTKNSLFQHLFEVKGVDNRASFFVNSTALMIKEPVFDENRVVPAKSIISNWLVIWAKIQMATLILQQIGHQGPLKSPT